MDNKKNSAAKISLIVGLIGLILTLVPIVVYLSMATLIDFWGLEAFFSLFVSMFVLGFVGVPLQIAGVVLGIQGLKSNRRHQSIAGLLASGIGLIIALKIIFRFVTTWANGFS